MYLTWGVEGIAPTGLHISNDFRDPWHYFQITSLLRYTLRTERFFWADDRAHGRVRITYCTRYLSKRISSTCSDVCITSAYSYIGESCVLRSDSFSRFTRITKRIFPRWCVFTKARVYVFKKKIFRKPDFQWLYQQWLTLIQGIPLIETRRGLNV